MNNGFFIRHFSVRGTEVSIYEYALYNELLLHNKSFIIFLNENKRRQLGFAQYDNILSYNKFKIRFPMIEIEDISEMKHIIKQYKLDTFYTQTHGSSEDIYNFNDQNIWDGCRTIKHCVSDTRYPEGDIYMSISNHLNQIHNTSIPVVPLMTSLVETGSLTTDNLRKELNIPCDAIVLGRHGGPDTFDLPIAHESIKEFLKQNNNIYFLLMNTSPFYTHPNIIYLEPNVDIIYKTKFINTCNAMIHAGARGETFGLAIAEFSALNKPVITCPCGNLEHIKILGDKGIYYNSPSDLINIFYNITHIINSKTDWNAYRDYSPRKIMDLFKTIAYN